MKLEDFNSEAYQAGVKAGETYNANPFQHIYDSLPNPYEYGTEDWRRWNMGWNYTCAHKTPTIE